LLTKAENEFDSVQFHVGRVGVVKELGYREQVLAAVRKEPVQAFDWVVQLGAVRLLEKPCFRDL